MRLADYVLRHTEHGECKCGRCSDVGTAPDPTHPHTVDLVFVKVAPRDHPDSAEFMALTREHHGHHAEVNPFDGKEHSYMELGAWLGDQGLALLYMALGTQLGLFRLLTPYTMLRLAEHDPLAMKMATAGYVAVQAKVAA